MSDEWIEKSMSILYPNYEKDEPTNLLTNRYNFLRETIKYNAPNNISWNIIMYNNTNNNSDPIKIDTSTF